MGGHFEIEESSVEEAERRRGKKNIPTAGHGIQVLLYSTTDLKLSPVRLMPSGLAGERCCPQYMEGLSFVMVEEGLLT